MNDEPIIDGEAKALERPSTSSALARHAAAPTPSPPPATLWRTDDPAVVVKRATKAADALAPVLREKGMITNIGGREHVNIEGWQTLGSMVGLAAAHPWTREIPWPIDARLTDPLREIRDRGYVFGYDAGYAILTLDGREVGGGEGTCKRTEEAWALRRGAIVDDYALKGMALTRAQSRAFASPLRFVVELAGFSGTPAEEVGSGPRPQDSGNGGNSSSVEPSKKQLDLIKRLVKEQGANEKEAALVRRYAKAKLKGGREGTASKAIARLQDEATGKAAARALWQNAEKWQTGKSPPPKPTEGPAASDMPVDTAGLDEPEQTKLEPEGK